jgi:hypothetical protein
VDDAGSLVDDAVGELGAGGHPELAEHFAQVVFHGARTDEQLGGDLPVRLSSAHQGGDLGLLGVGSFGVPISRLRACSPVAASPTRAHSAKQRMLIASNIPTAAQLIAGLPPSALAAQPLAVEQVGPGELRNGPSPAE